ncbi:hypothetical protein SD81_006440 [Tolypothrix campylonemoides VB511288]|nr:hypothetical protein SD81_006440 [Tolypothrix campylonemoides VB511288]
MKLKDRISLIVTGFVIWAAGTLVYRMAGSYFFEGSAIEYWTNVIITAILYCAVFFGLMKWRRIEPTNWLQGAVYIALPGMLCEVPILSFFSELMMNMQPETAGRYGAFLFWGYTSLISFALFISSKAGTSHTTDQHAT